MKTLSNHSHPTIMLLCIYMKDHLSNTGYLSIIFCNHFKSSDVIDQQLHHNNVICPWGILHITNIAIQNGYRSHQILMFVASKKRQTMLRPLKVQFSSIFWLMTTGTEKQNLDVITMSTIMHYDGTALSGLILKANKHKNHKTLRCPISCQQCPSHCVCYEIAVMMYGQLSLLVYCMITHFIL